MTTKRTLSLAGTAVMAALLAACGTTKLPDATTSAPVESRTPVAAAGAGGGAAAAGTAQSQVASVDLSKGAAGAAGAALLALPGQRIVYFDFDSFAIKDEFKPLLDSYAKVLSTSKGKRLVVEGHTDERGGREYNLALGQKRAAAVVKSLTLLGASDAQLEAVSFGEERPAAQGNDESAWSKNRRAELKDR